MSVSFYVGAVGLEPTQVASHAPEACASTNSATRPLLPSLNIFVDLRGVEGAKAPHLQQVTY